MAPDGKGAGKKPTPFADYAVEKHGALLLDHYRTSNWSAQTLKLPAPPRDFIDFADKHFPGHRIDMVWKLYTDKIPRLLLLAQQQHKRKKPEQEEASSSSSSRSDSGSG
jgi:hypothetical protein